MPVRNRWVTKWWRRDERCPIHCHHFFSRDTDYSQSDCLDMTWQAGYFAENGYTFGTYPQQSPSALGFVALLAGHRAVDLASQFSYLDLGCGQGFNTCLMAAAFPQARFVGIDFLPEHVAHAQGLAEASGLDNVRFIEADFRDLAHQRPSSWPEFDMAAAHGIASWVNPSVRTALIQLASKSLKPGGLFYVSYNTFPGWLATVPFQHLVSAFQRQCRPGQPSLDGAMELMAELRDVGAATFASYPGLKKRLSQIQQQDQAYLVQEYNNASWLPLFSDQMIQEAAAAKFTFLGNADLPLLFEGIYPEKFRSLLRQYHDDAPMRELIRDLLLNQSFRRDIYVKGKRRIWGQDQLGLLDGLSIASLVSNDALMEDDVFSFSSSFGKLKVNQRLYGDLMGLLLKAPQTIGQLRKALAHHFAESSESTAPMSRVLLPVALLMTKHMVGLAPDWDINSSPAIRLNKHIARACAAGAPYRAISLPNVSTSLSVSRTELLVLDSLASGHRGEDLVDQTLTRLDRLVPVQVQTRSEVDSSRRQMLAQQISRFLEHKLGLITRLGGWS